jgi:hypothetical protein
VDKKKTNSLDNIDLCAFTCRVLFGPFFGYSSNNTSTVVLHSAYVTFLAVALTSPWWDNAVLVPDLVWY